MKRKYIYICFTCLSLMLAGCLSEYHPEGIEALSGILVVDGTITDGETVIKLSKSVGIDDNFTSADLINDAVVNIETDNGEIFNTEKIEQGAYYFQLGTLNTNKKYRVNITYNGDQYQSSFLMPLITPPIDSVYFRKEPVANSDNQNICIYVATHDDNETADYYRWTYKEDWEYRSSLFAEIDSVEGVRGRIIIEYELGTPNNRYYCWATGESHRFILASTNKLSNNVIKDKRLTEDNVKNERWSQLYRIRVKQNRIRKEAYDYFSTLQKNVDEGGSLFAPIPSEMSGNIVCISNPDKPAIGYVEVSTTTNGEKYIKNETGIYEYPFACDVLSEGEVKAQSLIGIYKLYMYDELGNFLWAPGNCVDCTFSKDRTKNRPDDWPTNNY